MSCEVGDHEDTARNGVVADDLFPVGRAVLTVLALELGLAHELNLAHTGLPDGRAVAVVDTVPIPECAQVGIIVTPSPHDGHVGHEVIVIIDAVMLAVNTLRSAGGQHLVDGVKAVDGSAGSITLEVERLVQGVEVIMLYISVTVKLQLGQLEEVSVQNAVAAAVEGIVVDSGFLLHIHLNQGIHQVEVNNLTEGIVEYLLLGVVTEYLGVGPLYRNRVVVGGAGFTDELDGILGHHVLVGQGLVVVGRRCPEAVHKHQVIVPVDYLVVSVGTGQLNPVCQVKVVKGGNQHLLGPGTHRVLAVINLGGYGHGHVVVLIGTLQIGGEGYLLAVDVHVYIALTATDDLYCQIKILVVNVGRGRRVKVGCLDQDVLGRRITQSHARLLCCGGSRHAVITVATSHGDGDGASGGCRLTANGQGYLSVGRRGIGSRCNVVVAVVRGHGDRGLRRLRNGLLEDQLHSQVTILTNVEVPPCLFVGGRQSPGVAEVGFRQELAVSSTSIILSSGTGCTIGRITLVCTLILAIEICAITA